LKEGKSIIGRDQEADLTIDDVKASRKHCELELDDKGRVTVKDLGSGNGTHVNERKINEKVLVPGDRLRVGSVIFIYELRNREFFEQVADLPPVADEDNSEELISDDDKYDLQLINGGKEEDVEDSSYQQSPSVSQALIKARKKGLFEHSTINKTLPTGVGVSPETKVHAVGGAGGLLGGGAKGEKESLVSKWKKMEPRRRMIWIAIVGFALWTVIDEEAPKKRVPKSGKSGTGQKTKGGKGKVKGGVVTQFEQLTDDEKLLVDTSYNKAVRHVESTEFTMALTELERIFQYLPDYKEARNLQAVAKRGYAELTIQKRKLISDMEARKLEKEKQQLLAKLEQLRAEERYDEAVALFPRIFELEPDNILVAEIQEDIRKIEEEKARKAREDAAAEAERRKNLDVIAVARKLLSQNDYNGAIEQLKPLADLGGSAESSEAKDMIAYIKNEKDTKIAEFESAAEACKQEENKVCVFENYIKALAIDPSREELQEASRSLASEMKGAAKKIYTEAVISKSLGQVKKARDLFKQVLQRTPPGSDYNERAKRNLEMLFLDDEED
jgi:pSer/pThr/pTyr-binding forkhead associated (FHA) protein